MSLYGKLEKQEADYSAVVEEKIPECQKMVNVLNFY